MGEQQPALKIVPMWFPDGTPHLTNRRQMMFIHGDYKREKSGFGEQRRHMKDKDFFHLVTLEDGQKDSNAIIKVFQDIQAGTLPCDLKLLNYYREIPVSFSASITNVMDDRVDLNVHQNQAVVMKHVKQTLIKCEYFPNGLGVHCYVAMSNINSGRAILTRFAYAQITAERRGAVRVEVDFPLQGVFSAPGTMLAGDVADISVTGVSLHMPVKPAVETNIEGTFACTLPGGRVEVPARLLKYFDTEKGCRAVVTFAPDNKLELLLSQFIFSLQVEIIRDLKDQYL